MLALHAYIAVPVQASGLITGAQLEFWEVDSASRTVLACLPVRVLSLQAEGARVIGEKVRL